MTKLTEQDEAVLKVADACLAYAEAILASQMPIVERSGFDLLPSFMKTMTELYLAGIMWRFGEQFRLPTDARSRGFLCLLPRLMREGATMDEAIRHIAELLRSSRTAEGAELPVVTAGYNASASDGSLASVFETYRNVSEVSASQRQQEHLSAAIAGQLLRPWLPYGWARRSIMAVIALVGALTASSGGMLLWLLLPVFSPRAVGMCAYFLGRVVGSLGGGNR